MHNKKDYKDIGTTWNSSSSFIQKLFPIATSNLYDDVYIIDGRVNIHTFCIIFFIKSFFARGSLQENLIIISS